MKHNWKITDSGMYETDWKCARCNEEIETSADAPNDYNEKMNRDDCPQEKTLVERLQGWSSDDEEYVMKAWDSLRGFLLEGEKSDLPRMIFESVLDHLDEQRHEASALITELIKALELAQEAVCELQCPSVKQTGTEWTHKSDCERITALLAKAKGESQCDHNWVDARNKVVKSGEICLKCGALRAGNQSKEKTNEI